MTRPSPAIAVRYTDTLPLPEYIRAPMSVVSAATAVPLSFTLGNQTQPPAPLTFCK